MPRESKPDPATRREAVYTTILLVLVGGVLLIGAMLKAGPDSGPGGEGRVASVEAGGGAAGPPPPKRVEEADDEAALGLTFTGDADLADRAADDERRLYASGNGYTLQFAVVCEPENARSRLGALEGEPGFYLLTTVLEDRLCFRLCWGFYNSEAQARAARDVPAALREITGEPKVLSTMEALP